MCHAHDSDYKPGTSKWEGERTLGAEANDPAALRSNPLPQFRRLCGKYENANHKNLFP